MAKYWSPTLAQLSSANEKRILYFCFLKLSIIIVYIYLSRVLFIYSLPKNNHNRLVSLSYIANKWGHSTCPISSGARYYGTSQWSLWGLISLKYPINWLNWFLRVFALFLHGLRLIVINSKCQGFKDVGRQTSSRLIFNFVFPSGQTVWSYSIENYQRTNYSSRQI